MDEVFKPLPFGRVGENSAGDGGTIDRTILPKNLRPPPLAKLVLDRRVFVARCAALLQQQVSVVLVDVVTTSQFNLYGALLELIGQDDPCLAPEPPPLYAAACRWARAGDAWRFRAWTYTLTLGQPLPTLPLWLSDRLAVPLELEASYEETCRSLRIP